MSPPAGYPPLVDAPSGTAPWSKSAFDERRGRQLRSIISGEAWWARQGLNLRPLRCEHSALPLSYAPTLLAKCLAPERRD